MIKARKWGLMFCCGSVLDFINKMAISKFHNMIS